MEICYNKDKRFILVWMTNEEQKFYDRKKLTTQLLKDVDNPKCKVIFYLSGKGDLFENTKGLLLGPSEKNSVKNQSTVVK